MTAPVPPADAYVPVDMRWRLVRAGDVVLDPNGAPWAACRSEPTRGGWGTVLARGSRLLTAGADPTADTPPRDPEQTVRVLVPWPEAAGIVILREALGPVRVLDRGEVA